MNNPYGHFDRGGREFVITQPNIPRHWYNYLWNDQYVTFTSQVGHGEGFCQDDLGRRIQLVSSRQLYILDIGTGQYWTANGLPVTRDYEHYCCTHGQGYSTISLEYQGIESHYRLFVPTIGTCEIWTVTLKNNRTEGCDLKIVPFFYTDLDGIYRPQGYNTDIGYFDDAVDSVIAKTYHKFGSSDSRAVYGYLMALTRPTGYDSRKNAFIGTYGEESEPVALSQGGCQNSDCNAEKICFAIENTIHLAAGAECTFHYIAGIVLELETIPTIRDRFLLDQAVETEFARTVQRFEQQNAGVSIHTPSEELDNLFNHWLKHQTNLGSRWARVRHNGYRDMVSDSECLGSFNPRLAWKRLKRALTYQYSNGYAPRTWLEGQIKDNNFADNAVWITFAIHSLLMELGERELLEEEVAFNDGSTATVYEHAKRAVDFLWNFRGLHGLIKIWGGDWNDLMNQAGLKGQGVSVWLSIAWYRANQQFAELAQILNREDDLKLAEIRGDEMRRIVDTFGWDGDYYLTAYTDAGEKLGASTCAEGKIFLIPQLWAVLSGIAPEEKALKAMEMVERYLETPLGTLVSWPGYHSYQPEIGTMTQKPAGVHENGGVYLHPATWKLAVDSLLKRNSKVQEGLEKILPWCAKWAEKKCEPYIMCNSYFTHETGYREGTAGQSWRTATGAWLTKALITYVFGLRPRLEGLQIKPCLPPDWKECAITKEFRDATYHIVYTQKSSGPCNHIAAIYVNGKTHVEEVLPYEEGKTYEVQVILEQEK